MAFKSPLIAFAGLFKQLPRKRPRWAARAVSKLKRAVRRKAEKT